MAVTGVRDLEVVVLRWMEGRRGDGAGCKGIDRGGGGERKRDGEVGL